MPTSAQNLIRESKQIASNVRLLPRLRLSTLGKVFSLMGRQERIIAIILLGIAFASATFSLNKAYLAITVPKPTNGGEYDEAIIGQPRLINPLLASTETDDSIVNLVFSGLYKYGNAGALAPDLAESLPTIDATQKQYTVKLKHGVTWHNGKPFSADDVVFTIHTLQDPRYNSPHRSEWMNTTVEKTDDFTIVFKVRDVSGPFITNLTLPILSKAVWENVKPDAFVLSQDNLEAIGTGPFRITEIKKLPQGTIQSIKLQAFTDYSGSKPHLDTVKLVFYDNYDDVLQGLHGRQTSGFGFVPFDKNLYLDKDSSALQILQLPLPQYQAAFFNLSNKIFADKTVRKALNTATDKQNILHDVFNGNALLLDGPVLPEQVTKLPKSTTTFNHDVAAQMLDAAGWKLNPQSNLRTKGNVAMEFTIATNDFALNTKTAEKLADQWKSLGIKVKLNILPTKELTETVIRPRKFDVLVFAQKLGPDPDPFIFWHSSQSKNPGLNLTGFNNPIADKLISEARSNTNKNIRDDKYRQFQALISEETPAIFLNQSMYIYAIDHSMKGVGLANLYDTPNRFYDLPNWYLDERRVLK